MIKGELFHDWLKTHTAYSDEVVGDIVSRMKRADSILEWDATITYIFFLEQDKAFQNLSVSVRSQIRKSVKLYMEFCDISCDKNANG